MQSVLFIFSVERQELRGRKKVFILAAYEYETMAGAPIARSYSFGGSRGRDGVSAGGFECAVARERCFELACQSRA